MDPRTRRRLLLLIMFIVHLSFSFIVYYFSGLLIQIIVSLVTAGPWGYYMAKLAIELESYKSR
jgi:hypothetical protein